MTTDKITVNVPSKREIHFLSGYMSWPSVNMQKFSVEGISHARAYGDIKLKLLGDGLFIVKDTNFTRSESSASSAVIDVAEAGNKIVFINCAFDENFELKIECDEFNYPEIYFIGCGTPEYISKIFDLGSCVPGSVFISPDKWKWYGPHTLQEVAEVFNSQASEIEFENVYIDKENNKDWVPSILALGAAAALAVIGGRSFNDKAHLMDKSVMESERWEKKQK